MLRALWNGQVIAEARRTRLVGGVHYFPPECVNRDFLSESSTATLCPWKGVAHYYTVTVDGATNPDAAWYYPHPFPLARRIKDHVAFWMGVSIDGIRE